MSLTWKYTWTAPAQGVRIPYYLLFFIAADKRHTFGSIFRHTLTDVLMFGDNIQLNCQPKEVLTEDNKPFYFSLLVNFNLTNTFVDATGAVFNLLSGNIDKMIMEKVEKQLNHTVIEVNLIFNIFKLILSIR